MTNVVEQGVQTQQRRKRQRKWLQWILVATLVYVLVCAVGMIGSGFKVATADKAQQLFAFAVNPFAGLVAGTIATAFIQSSSTISSIIVGLVAGGLPVSVAVPMVMGANIGTSITNTIVSLGYLRDKGDFKRAFSAATVHDFFNLLSVMIFLPVEIAFGVLEKLGGALASVLYDGKSVSIHSFNFVKAATEPVVDTAKGIFLSFGDRASGVLLILFGIVCIFVAITFAGKLLKKLISGRAKGIIHTAIGRGSVSGIASGMLVTILVQSSSTTTSLMVPLAGSGTFGLRQIYPFVLGANVGTCVTAVLAATAVTGNAEAALQIAFIHLSYNVLGVLVIFGLPFLRMTPVRCAEWLGAAAAQNKSVAFVYVLGVFFVVPGLCLTISHLVA